MKMSTKARYGMYAAVILGKRYEEGFIKVTDVSKEIEVSDGYLEQIFALLKRGGIIESQRGACGGYRLIKSPSETSVGSILRAVEDNLEIVDCLSGKCKRSKVCVSHNLWNNLYNRINEYLDSISLIQLIEEEGENVD
ncbi:MAG: Rrf2 family transcriptional regulator [Clostridia bacterium]